MTIDTPKKQSGWNKFFKGNERGGAWIYTHPDSKRAIVENHYGITYAGRQYSTLRAAKRAALKYYRHRGTVECHDCQGQGTKEGTNCPECKGSGRLP